MKKIKFAAVLLFAVLTDCSSSESSTLSNGNFSVASAKNTAAVDTGGGGGGRDEQIVQQISLNQAESSQPPVAAERKIIRNAELELEANSSEDHSKKLPPSPKAKADS